MTTRARVHAALLIAPPGTGTKLQLLSDGNDASTAEVETHAGVVTVRPLTRAEALQISEGTPGLAEFEQQMVALGLVDPVMTEAEVKAWQERELAGRGALGSVADRIAQLSGLNRS